MAAAQFDSRIFKNFSQESNAWVEQIIAKIRQILSTFKYQHIIKAPPIDTYNARADTSAPAAPEDTTIDVHNNNFSDNAHAHENFSNSNIVAPTKMLCESIAHKNNFMKIQLKFLLEHLSEAYE